MGRVRRTQVGPTTIGQAFPGGAPSLAVCGIIMIRLMIIIVIIVIVVVVVVVIIIIVILIMIMIRRCAAVLG